jgi:hypothetical protein
MKFCIGLLLLLGCTSTLQAEEVLPAYSLSNTVVHQLPARSNGRHYEVWIDLPAGYTDVDANRQQAYPALFVTDANYAFPLIRSIRNRLGAGGQNIADFVLVGLSYARQDSPTDSRSLDYTPTNVLAKKSTKGQSYGAKAYGGASLYADYLRQQVIPFVLQHYRVDPKQKIFVGHSYGGLLGAQMLLTQPDTFDSYILSSPSLWFDQGYVLKQAQQQSASQARLSATVQLYAGEYEQIKAGARYARTISIVADMQQFETILRQRNADGLRIHSQVIADEDHLSVFPSMISRALVKLLPGTGPYTPG